VSLLFELAGLACLVVMGFVLCPAAGWGIAGAGLLLIGQAADGVRLPKLRRKR
jgi:hypothetical protein